MKRVALMAWAILTLAAPAAAQPGAPQPAGRASANDFASPAMRLGEELPATTMAVCYRLAAVALQDNPADDDRRRSYLTWRAAYVHVLAATLLPAQVEEVLRGTRIDPVSALGGMTNQDLQRLRPVCGRVYHQAQRAGRRR